MVCECVNKLTGEHAAVKIIDKSTIEPEEKGLLRTEIAGLVKSAFFLSLSLSLSLYLSHCTPAHLNFHSVTMMFKCLIDVWCVGC